jgi:hypothetical protein
MLVELSGLVIGGFQDCGTSHSGLRGSYDGEIFASDAE